MAAGASSVPKRLRDTAINGIVAIVAAVISAGATLYATHWQLDSERELRKEAEQKVQQFKANTRTLLMFLSTNPGGKSNLPHLGRMCRAPILGR